MSAKRLRPWWAPSGREARVHAWLLAVVLWITAAVLIVATPGSFDLAGQLKGADFVHFYTLGHIGLDADTPRLYDKDAQHDLQIRLIPASGDVGFLPVNSPQLALLFAPFALLPYGVAALLWAATTAVGYALGLALVRRRFPGAYSDTALFIGAAAAFPPFWNLLLFGQSTLWVYLAFLGFGLAFARGWDFVAGLALGFVVVKPAFGPAVLLFLIVRPKWRAVAGLALSGAVQVAAVALAFGPAVLSDYMGALRIGLASASALEPRPFHLHSLRQIADILPAPVSLVVWLLACVFVIQRLVRAWPLLAAAPRVALLIVAALLMSPHLTIYDVTVLSLPLVWLGGWIETSRPDLRSVFWPSVYALFLTLLLPAAALIRVQPSVVLLLWLYIRLTRRTPAPAALTHPASPA